jgi:hypothetical protein
MGNATIWRGRFHFNDARGMTVGIDRDFFVAGTSGILVPEAERALERVSRMNGFRAESFAPGLSAAQGVARIGPCTLRGIARQIKYVEDGLREELARMHLAPLFTEVVPETTPTAPHNCDRARTIAKSLPTESYVAACRIATTRILVAMPNHKKALKVYNKVASEWERLQLMGDRSRGKRAELYRIAHPHHLPRQYRTWEEFEACAERHGFAQDPSANPALIRISPEGGVEFQTFGATSSIEAIVSWAHECHRLCSDAMF